MQVPGGARKPKQRALGPFRDALADACAAAGRPPPPPTFVVPRLADRMLAAPPAGAPPAVPAGEGGGEAGKAGEAGEEGGEGMVGARGGPELTGELVAALRRAFEGLCQGGEALTPALACTPLPPLPSGAPASAWMGAEVG
jgi:hypothetical protein